MATGSVAAPQLRIGDTERDQAIAALGEHYARGRLSRPEFDDRSDAVAAAKTRGDLASLFADLPEPTPEAVRPQPEVEWRRPRRPVFWPVPFGPVFIVLVVLTVMTHIPFVLMGFALFFIAIRWRFRVRSKALATAYKD
jgi:uncharacterized membrane protein